jgi:lipopolysaccharide biosynthesis regulator YciM
MSDLALIGVFVALLLGLVAGKAWERYKLRDGRWIDRRRLRDTPHYMLGLHCLLDNQTDQAIDELTRAASSDADALEIQMILGNLYRQKGQVGKAIAVHQALLQRPDLRTLEHAYILLCLGLDYRHGGFVDRAIETFQEVVRLDPHNRYAYINLQKLHEDQHQWADAADVRERMSRIDANHEDEHRHILGFLRNQIGDGLAAAGDFSGASRAFQDAIEVDERTAPAYLSLGDTRERQGQLAAAVESWETLVQTLPDRAHLAFERLERAYRDLGAPGRFVALCERLIAASPQDWRTRLALSRHLSAAGHDRRALDLLLDALPHNPHGLAIHQATWRVLSALGFERSRGRRYVDQTRGAVFYLDPHVCLRCRYRSTELLWQCPQCHEWNTFVEERIAPAKTSGVAELVEP